MAYIPPQWKNYSRIMEFRERAVVITKAQMEKVLFDLLADWKKKQNEEG